MIALFYGSGLHLEALVEVLVAVGCLVFFNRARVARPALYLLAGIALWHGFHEIGVHATLAGSASVCPPSRPSRRAEC